MSFTDSAKRMIGRALKPFHAGDDKLLTHHDELLGTAQMPRRIEIHSDAFSDDGAIPVRYSGEGANISPPLKWSGVPTGTKELVLVCEDPDAPFAEPYLHWIMSGIEPGCAGMPEGVSKVRAPSEVHGLQGDNGSSQPGYTGPIPPMGHGAHHYHFELFALDQKLNVGEDPDRDELLEGMGGHILAMGDLVGTYERK